MSINNIKKLSMNPHFYSLLMQSFLSGYEKPCEIKLPFMAIPILLYAESREKLVNANRRSRIDTLFQSPQLLMNVRFLVKQGYLAMLTDIIHLNHIVKKQLLFYLPKEK